MILTNSTSLSSASSAYYAAAISGDGSVVFVGAAGIPRFFYLVPLNANAGRFRTRRARLLTGFQSTSMPSGALGTWRLASVRAQDMEFGGQGSIYGPVELYNQAGNIPLRRRVRLHRSRDGLLVRETWSDDQGNYRFDGISERYTYDVIAWDHEGLQQSVVANDLQPEPMQ